MDPRALRVLADDLTGACDIATALLPWSGPVVVETHAGAPRPAGAALWVRNTQSRTLPVAEARRAVQQAVADAGAARAVVLKKIDTALRGHLGAELEAAMEAAGAAEVFVLPAIPAVGRTTVGGVQLLDGVPVHRTAFAADPLHPVDRSEVAAHVERGSSRRCRVLALEEVRSRARLAAAIERGREADETVFVCDAVTDDDLDAALAVLLERPRPLVLAGSLGLGRALRRRLAVDGSPAERPRPGRPALVVVGSAHPNARGQCEALGAASTPGVGADGSDAERAGAMAAATLASGRTAVIRPLPEIASGDEARVLAALGRAAAACVRARRPGALALVGGETAHAVLRALAQPALRVVEALEPLVVGGELTGGTLAGTPVVTKGGSSGDAGSLVRALAWMEGAS